MTVASGRRNEKEIDVRTNLGFVERQRNRYASRGVALIILINSIAAIALLVSLAHGAASGQNLKSFADAMMVFGVGAAAGLASIFFAYLRRLLRLERPLHPWFAIAAAIAGAVCFVSGLGVARNAVSSEKAAIPPAAVSPDTTPP